MADSNDTITEAPEPAPTTVTDSNDTVTEVTVLPESTENTDAQTELPAEPDSQMTATTEETPVKTELILKIDGQKVSVTWEDNESVTALRELAAEAPITIQMSMYGGFEQVGPIGTSLPRSDVQTTTEAGDIVLYSGSQIVVFYGSNSWAYLYKKAGNVVNSDLYRDFDPEEVHRALAKKGETLKRLWKKYNAAGTVDGRKPLSYRQYCRRYAAWIDSTKVTFHIQRFPGVNTELDYAGKTLRLRDRRDPDLTTPVTIFVAALSFSDYFYI